MIQLNADIPSKCVDCFAYSDKEPGQCKLDGRWFGEEDDWIYKTRPNWCPIVPVYRCENCGLDFAASEQQRYFFGTVEVFVTCPKCQHAMLV